MFHGDLCSYACYPSYFKVCFNLHDTGSYICQSSLTTREWLHVTFICLYLCQSSLNTRECGPGGPIKTEQILNLSYKPSSYPIIFLSKQNETFGH